MRREGGGTAEIEEGARIGGGEKRHVWDQISGYVVERTMRRHERTEMGPDVGAAR